MDPLQHRHDLQLLCSSGLVPETIVEPLKYQTEAESPHVLFTGRILNLDAITEVMLIKDICVHRVLSGICADIKTEGGKVTISALVDYTGLARSTFANPHIRKLLVEYGYSSGNGGAVSPKRQKAQQSEIIEEKDRQIVFNHATG